MNWWLPHNFDKKRPYLKMRSRVIGALRRWFDGQDFDAVETSILQVCPVMDTHIHGFKTELIEPDLQTRHTMYLHTSPEFAMKKLLVAGMQRIYQIAPVFRNGDSSRLHSPEFSLLEWYRAHTDYQAMMEDCVDLIRAVGLAVEKTTLSYGDIVCDMNKPWQKLSVAAAFESLANIDLEQCLENPQLFAQRAREQNIRVAADDGWDDIFFRVMAERIEPTLGQGTPTILYDYPVALASLSKRKESNPNYAERFELYICGIEIANAFSELTDCVEQTKRFESEMQSKERFYGQRYPIDQDFIKALECGMPESSGIALGIDRLVMLFSGAECIDQVLWAPVTTQD